MPELTKIQTGFLEPQGAFELDSGTAGAPGSFFSGSSSTGFYSPGLNQIGITISQTPRLIIDASGRLVFGGLTSARTNFLENAGDQFNARYQFEGTGQSRILSITSNNTDGGSGAVIYLSHEKSGTLGGNTVLSSGNQTGAISFQGSDGTNFVRSAQIAGFVDGTVSSGLVPGAITFSTSSDGAPTEKVRIASTGNVGIGTTDPTQKLSVVGDSYTSGKVLVGTTTLITKLAGSVNDLGATVNVATSAFEFGAVFCSYRNTTAANAISIARSKTSTIGGHGLIGPNEIVSGVNFDGSDGTQFITAAQVVAGVEGTPAEGNMPSFITFRTNSGNAINATDKVRITSAGNVGIGTTNPSTKLHVEGNIFTSRDSSVVVGGDPQTGGVRGIKLFDNSTASIGLVSIGRSSGSTNKLLQGFGVIDSTTSTETSYISADGYAYYAGNVGIGTTNPISKLDVRGVATLIAPDGDPILNISSNISYIRDISDGTNDAGNAIVQLGGLNGSYVICVQDGVGRIQHRWNSTIGTTPTFLVANENAGSWQMNASASGELFKVYKAAGAAAGDAITFSPVFATDIDELSYWGGGYHNAYKTFSIIPSDYNSATYSPTILRLTTKEPSSAATTAAGDAYGAIEFAVYGAEINDNNSVAQTVTNNVISAIKAIDWRDGNTTNEDAGIGFYTTQAGVTPVELTFRGGFSNDGSFFVGSFTDQGDIAGQLQVDWDTSKAPYSNALHLRTVNDAGSSRTLQLTNMYDRDTGIVFRSGDANGANQADRWFIWNDAGVATASSNNRFNISPDNNVVNGLTILQNNNVGIGTGIPSYKLDVNGIIRSTDQIYLYDAVNLVTWSMTYSSNGDFYVTKPGTGGAEFVISNTANYLDSVVTTQNLTSKKVGINTDPGTHPLEVYSTSSTSSVFTSQPQANPTTLDASQFIQFNRTTAVSGLTYSSTDKRLLTATVTADNVIAWRASKCGLVASDYISLSTGTTSPQETRITSAGNVGIGVTNPVARLEIGGTAAAGVPGIDLSPYNASVSSVSDIVLSPNSVLRSSASINNVVNTSGYFRWYIGGTDVKSGISGATEVMRIDPSGNVGIGITNPSYKFHVIGSSYSDFLYAKGGTVGGVVVGDTGGSASLTTNDGGGNANICFNHRNIIPDSNGSSGRISVSVDSTTAVMAFSLLDNVTAGVSGATLTKFSITTAYSEFSNNLIAKSEFRIQTSSPPASSTATGSVGTITWDSNYIYVCTATNTWRRAALSTW